MDVHSFYIGPGNPPLRISNWDDLVSAAVTGTLTETQWVELKAAIPVSSPEANLELARDLASLSVDGGVLTVGVKNPGTKSEHVVGTTDDMEGLKSRIDQIAGSTRIQPPLNIQLAPPIVNTADPTRAVLLVTVPASASAPHMVDGKYWGRGATGKRHLLDVEVSRLMMERRGRRDDFVEKLRLLEFGPLPGPAERQYGHLRIMAEPAINLARPPLTDVATSQNLRQLVTGSLSFHPQWNPSLESLMHKVDHPDGLALTSWPLSADPPPERTMLYLLLTDGGSVQVASGQGTRPYGRGEDRIGIPSNFIMEIVHQTLGLAAHLGKSYLSYSGLWTVEVHLSGIAGHLPLHAFHEDHWDFKPSPFQSAEYSRTSTASTKDLADRTNEIVETLLGDLARGMGLRSYLFPYTNPAEIQDKI